MLQVCFAGTAPNVGEYHYAFPSDCFPRSARSGSLVIGAPAPPGDIAESREALVNEWKALGRTYARGGREGHARWLPGCPVRVSRGGVGGNRLLLLTPDPASWDLWVDGSCNLRNVNFARLAEVDKLDDPAESLSHRAKQRSPSGAVAAYASKNSSQRRHNPAWPPRSVRVRKVRPLADGMILHEE